MKHWMIAAAVSAALFGCSAVKSELDSAAPAAVTLVETVEHQAGQANIPYKKYRLANGLTVILHQDNSDPLVHVDVTYHVGSAREFAGRSGFAHLFEHMMFQGSQNVADEQHFKVITEAGGTLNGTTNTDRTNYFETVPSNQLEKMLWLESDRMGFFLPALTSEKFEVQRETVKNERAQRIDNRPYGRLNERFSQALYPAGHPYSWPVIGWPEDLERATLADVKHFFQRWYGPNNATLTIGGDFDEAQTLAWVEKYFGEIPAGPEVKADEKVPVTLDKTRYISMEDKVHLPLIYMGYPTVYAGHKDEAALDLLANIIGGGKTSLFYKNMVEQGVAVQAAVSHPCQELACQFTLYALANPAQGGELAKLEEKIAQSVAEFESRGVTDEDLQKVKVQFEADTIYGMQSVKGKVSTLAANQTFYGNPDQVTNDLARYASVTKEDVMRVFNTYIKDKPMVVMSVVPEGQTQLVAKPDNFIAPSPQVAEHAVDVEIDAEQIVSSFDRSVMPKAGDAPVVKVPKLWRSKLENGIEVVGTKSDETPTVELVVYLDGGHRLEPVEQSGLAYLTAAMLNESTTKRNSVELANALEMLGSSIHFSANASQSSVQLSSLTANLPQTLSILEEQLFSPAFNEQDFNRVKQQHLQFLQQRSSDANYLARTEYGKLLYGDNVHFGIGASGSIESVSKLTLDDVRAFYQLQYRAGNAKVVAVSDLTQQQVTSKLGALASWQGEATELAPVNPIKTAKTGAIYLYDKPDAPQSVISIGRLALPFDATGEYFKADLMNYPLGGAFNSRINLNLREDKGYTYGARSYFYGVAEVGTFTAGASVRADVTGDAVKEFIAEINQFKAQGMTDKELSFMRSSISQGHALEYETPYQKAGFLRRIQRYQLADDYTAEQQRIIESVTKQELNALADKWLNIDDMVILVVGDKATVKQQLEQLGYPVKMLN
ncbi:insulinase family protein [Shewanella maritima]|uniref:Insulinase family protein n=1 Tax=Shewanella maritima TaxID=2520507 RepID=A0A411PF83_9GAMM|nr:pitrilysin family protein [Shewanella maritima]QBF82138.1 insulinase family protein [Shewanella maritima]